MKRVSTKQSSLTPLLSLGVAALIIGVGLLYLAHASGALLDQRSLSLTNSQPSAVSTYKLGFTINTASTLGSIRAQFCANNPLIGQPCTVPDGFDISGATLAAQTGETGFTISGSTTANVLILTRLPTAAAAVPATYTLTGVTNPSGAGSYYVRLQTFSTSDASGSDTDYGGLAFAISNAFNVSVIVPPYLRFCVGATIVGFDCNQATGNYLKLGELSAAGTTSAETQLVTATNADNGYTIRVMGNTLTSGNNIIPALLSSDVAKPGVGQFGINLSANTTPPVGEAPQGAGTGQVAVNYDQPNFYRFQSGDMIASSSLPTDNNKYTVSYIVNIPRGQPAGVYVTTLTYVAVGNF